MPVEKKYKGVPTAEELMKKFNLTHQQAWAALHFVAHGKKMRAMREAGYTEQSAAKSANAVFGRPNVKAAIQWLMDQKVKRSMISADRVLEHIRDIAIEAKDTGDHNSALRALELLGKHLGMSVDKKEITHKNPFAQSEDPEEIKKNIERMAKIAAPKLKVVEGGK